jgi:hypothetical protein
MAHGLTLNQY